MPADLPDWQTNVNISGQSVTINESITGQTVAVYSGSQYAPVQGNGVFLYGTSGNVAAGSLGQCISYTVPAGKTLFVQGCGIGLLTSTAMPYGVLVQIWDNGSATLSLGAGTSGMTIVFDSPVPFSAAHNVVVYGYYQGAAASEAFAGTLWGWLR